MSFLWTLGRVYRRQYLDNELRFQRVGAPWGWVTLGWTVYILQESLRVCTCNVLNTDICFNKVQEWMCMNLDVLWTHMRKQIVWIRAQPLFKAAPHYDPLVFEDHWYLYVVSLPHNLDISLVQCIQKSNLSENGVFACFCRVRVEAVSFSNDLLCP